MKYILEITTNNCQYRSLSMQISKLLLEKVDSCQPSDKKSYTEANQKHTDCGYGYKVVCCYDDKYSKPVQVFRGENAVHNFMENMLGRSQLL